MLPRGEVGLIFATIGLQNGVLGDDLYAALLLVVLVTTLVTPPLLKVRYQRLRADSRPVAVPLDTPPPDGGWLRVDRDEVDLRPARPTGSSCRSRSTPPSPWRGADRRTASSTGWPTPTSGRVPFTRELTSKLLDVIERGNARSWRFLETSGVLDAALPELAAALRRRAGDGISLDGSRAHRLQVTRAAAAARRRRPARPGGAGARARRPPAAGGLPHRVARGRAATRSGWPA